MRNLGKTKFLILVVVVLIIIVIFYLRFLKVDSHNSPSGMFSFLNVENVDTIRMQNGTTGEYIDLESFDAVRETIDYLNTIPYEGVVSVNNEDSGGWLYRMVIYKDGQTTSYYFTEDCFFVNGAKYQIDKKHIEDLLDRFDIR